MPPLPKKRTTFYLKKHRECVHIDGCVTISTRGKKGLWNTLHVWELLLLLFFFVDPLCFSVHVALPVFSSALPEFTWYDAAGQNGVQAVFQVRRGDWVRSTPICQRFGRWDWLLAAHSKQEAGRVFVKEIFVMKDAGEFRNCWQLFHWTIEHWWEICQCLCLRQ